MELLKLNTYEANSLDRLNSSYHILKICEFESKTLEFPQIKSQKIKLKGTGMRKKLPSGLLGNVRWFSIQVRNNGVQWEPREWEQTQRHWFKEIMSKTLPYLINRSWYFMKLGKRYNLSEKSIFKKCLVCPPFSSFLYPAP